MSQNSNTGFPHYLKAEYSYEIFPKWKWHKVNYLRTHPANGCSQMQFKATELDAEMLGVVPREGVRGATLPAWGVSAGSLQNKC